MNPHLNIFNNYREDSNPLENNLTRAFIITLQNEPNLLRDFMYLISKELLWDEITVSIQDKNVDISGFERVIGVALTAVDISNETIQTIKGDGSVTPIPDFLVYNSRTLIVGEVKKHGEIPIAQLKNQVSYLLEKRIESDIAVEVSFQALTWTEVLSKLIIPHINYSGRSCLKPVWATNFKEYIATHYSDWLPVPNLDKIDFSTDADSVTKQLIEKRLYTIQSLTKFGTPNYWVGGRITMPINFGWATEALVKLSKHNGKNVIQLTIWPADTKAQGTRIFNKSLEWINTTALNTAHGKYLLDITPYIKFSHVMGRWIGAIYFNGQKKERGKKFHTPQNFRKFCRNWERSKWPTLTKMLDEELSPNSEWRNEVNWDAEFEHTGRNFVFISMGFECNTFIPFKALQTAEQIDLSGTAAAELLQSTIETFRKIVDGGDNK
jgi:hypothetical protein